ELRSVSDVCEVRGLVRNKHVGRTSVIFRPEYIQDHFIGFQGFIPEPVPQFFHLIFPEIAVYFTVNRMAVILWDKGCQCVDPLPVEDVSGKEDDVLAFCFGFMEDFLVDMLHPHPGLSFGNAERFNGFYQ
ncbi:hypothetical protein COLO4_01871, partial [Corchorus olitorius]